MGPETTNELFIQFTKIKSHWTLLDHRVNWIRSIGPLPTHSSSNSSKDQIGILSNSPRSKTLIYSALYSILYYSTVLHCTALYCTVLYATTLLYFGLHHPTPLHSTPFHPTPFHSVPFYITLLFSYSTLLYCTLFYSIPFHLIQLFSNSFRFYSLLTYLIMYYSTLLSLYSILFYSTLIPDSNVLYSTPFHSKPLHSIAFHLIQSYCIPLHSILSYYLRTRVFPVLVNGLQRLRHSHSGEQVPQRSCQLLIQQVRRAFSNTAPKR